MNITKKNEPLGHASYTVKENEQLHLSLAHFEAFPASDDIEIHVGRNASFVGALADFSHGKGTLRISVYLEGEGSRCEFHGAVLSKQDDDKTIEVNIHHLAPHTEGLAESYGISEEGSRLIFTGISQIAKGSKGSKTRQSAKIIVFDPHCVARCSPILKIDENDVSASHAAVVGKLNEEHVFYLLSRGLDLAQARRLITLGYLKPIETYFADSDRDPIDRAIEEEV